MKNIVLAVLSGLIPTLEALAKGFETDVEHPQKVLIGQCMEAGLAFLQAALDGMHGKPVTIPTLPDSLTASA